MNSHRLEVNSVATQVVEKLLWAFEKLFSQEFVCRYFFFNEAHKFRLSVLEMSKSKIWKKFLLEINIFFLFYFQVVDFLSGKAPLNLTMRLGDHMMLIQLQLSTVNSSSNLKRSSRAGAAGGPTIPTVSRTPVSSNNTTTTSASAASTTSEASAGATSNNSSSSTSSYKPKLDTRALSEASKNLTQTLKQLSSEVLTTKCEEVSWQRIKELKKLRQRLAYSSLLLRTPSFVITSLDL